MDELSVPTVMSPGVRPTNSPHLRNPWNATAIAAHNIRQSWSERLVLTRTRSQSWRSTGVVIGCVAGGSLVSALCLLALETAVCYCPLDIGGLPGRADFARLTYIHAWWMAALSMTDGLQSN